MRIVLELEDTFGDITRKASRGTGITGEALAAKTGIAPDRIAAFVADKARPTEDEARAVASALGLDPGKLADIALGRWKPQERDLDHRFDHQVNKPHPSNGYFVILEDQRIAAFVDPGGRAQNIVGTLRRSPVALRYILVTHKHKDHTDALQDVRRAFPDAKVVIHRLDSPELGDAARDAIAINDGDRLPFGDGEIRLIHTPGHTDGSSCFIYEANVFTGDTLFAGSIGAQFG